MLDYLRGIFCAGDMSEEDEYSEEEDDADEESIDHPLIVSDSESAWVVHYRSNIDFQTQRAHARSLNGSIPAIHPRRTHSLHRNHQTRTTSCPGAPSSAHPHSGRCIPRCRLSRASSTCCTLSKPTFIRTEETLSRPPTPPPTRARARRTRRILPARPRPLSS